MSTINIVFWQKSCHVRYDASIHNLVTTGVAGFEPTMRESKSLALPLGYTPSAWLFRFEQTIQTSNFLLEPCQIVIWLIEALNNSGFSEVTNTVYVLLTLLFWAKHITVGFLEHNLDISMVSVLLTFVSKLYAVFLRLCCDDEWRDFYSKTE